MCRFFTSTVAVFVAVIAFAQQNVIDSFQSNGIYRNFILHVPQGYSGSQKYALVLNLHGLTSNADQEMQYTNMNAIADADAEPFLVVYPNGVNNSWQPINATVNDVAFLSALIDTVSSRYNIDSTAVFSCGMSNGGITSYLLACALSDKIAAIASVSGTMANSTYANCAPSRKIPVLHIHGTADPVVGYDGSGIGAGILKDVETTISFWRDTNDCLSASDTTAVPNISITDSCTADLIRWQNCAGFSEVYFYKILGGGHTWPDGLIDITQYGKTNRDFNASQAIWNFFKRHKKGQDISGVKEVNNLSASILPNPFGNALSIRLSDELPTTVSIFDIAGKQIFREENIKQNTVISTENLAAGMYVVHLQNRNGMQVCKVAKE